MKRTTVVLSAAAVMGLPATTLADDQAGWGVILNPRTSETDPIATAVAGNAAKRAAAPRTVLHAGPACTLWDNGVPDGVNGYSNGTEDAFGIRRTLLDDIVVPEGKEWTITGMHHYHLWNTEAPGSGETMEISIWSDGNGTPGAPIGVVSVSTYSEVGTGNTYFMRDESLSFTTFDPPVVLEAGRYWFEATVVGPENNFWLTAPQLNEECWVNYDDSGFQPGSGVFAGPSDIAWCFDGTEDLGPTNANGLRHFPLGQAVLTRNENGTLTVSNIGLSGDDGFTSELGDGAGGWGASGDLAGAPQPGATMDILNIGTLGGNPDTSMGGTQVVVGSGGMQVGATLDNLDATTYTQTLYNNDVIVDCLEDIPGGSLSATLVEVVTAAKCFCRILPPPANVVWEISIDAATSVTTANGTFDADRIEFTPSVPTPTIESLSRIHGNVADTSDLDVTSETIQMFGVGNSKIANARLLTSSGTLQVTGIGIAGDDGVSMSLPSATNLDINSPPIPTSTNGQSIRLIATGTVGGTPGTVLGYTFLANGSGFLLTDSDFSDISTSNVVRVEVYDDGALVGSADVPGGGNFETLILTILKEGSPNVISFGMRPTDGGDPAGYYFQFDRNANVQPVGNPILQGDEVRLLVAEPDGAITSFSQVDVRLAKNQLTVTGASYNALPTGACCIDDGCAVLTEEQCGGRGGDYSGDETVCKPNPCGAECVPSPDTDGSGCVDFADILLILSAWGGPGPEGDADCSGVVDFADILEVLSAWGDGCP